MVKDTSVIAWVYGCYWDHDDSLIGTNGDVDPIGSWLRHLDSLKRWGDTDIRSRELSSYSILGAKRREYASLSPSELPFILSSILRGKIWTPRRLKHTSVFDEGIFICGDSVRDDTALGHDFLEPAKIMELDGMFWNASFYVWGDDRADEFRLQFGFEGVCWKRGTNNEKGLFEGWISDCTTLKAMANLKMTNEAQADHLLPTLEGIGIQ